MFFRSLKDTALGIEQLSELFFVGPNVKKQSGGLF
jgi:hypothetical protein